uniref:Uncharacterized protein n=1 Tax=Rhizophagus irregularis (strain DAOM 181602 / DAOM 197198 / MUCL 43194) TaxID=747089 RepID=U9SP91_RHIID
MSERNPKRRKTTQTTLNFVPEFYTISIPKSQTTNIQKQKLTNNVQKSLFDFLPNISTKKKHSIKEINVSSDDNSNSNDENQFENSEDDESSDDSASSSDYELNDECQCGKEVKLDRKYRPKNLISHAKSSNCQIRKDMRCYFFLQMWKEYLLQCNEIYQNKWYLISKTCISMQSFKIFTSLAESMLLLILAYRKYYLTFSFFSWEHGTKAIEHVFGLARQIPSDDDIGDAIRIAYINVSSFMNLLGIKKINQESLRLVDSSSDLNENDNGEHNNLELIEDQNQIDNAASEIVRLSKLDENLKIFDTIRSNDDDESNSEGKNNQPTFINPTEKELEEEIFRNNNLPDVYQILSIRRSHDAYSRSDRIRGIRQQPGINLNIGSNDNVDRNTANHLITQLNSNDLNRQTVNNRTNRWLE